MPILSNLNHESFCQLVAKGDNATSAYRSVYGKRGYKSAGTSASKLLSDKKNGIFARILEIKEEKSAEILRKTLQKVDIDFRNKEIRIQKLAEVAQKIEKTISARAELYSKLPHASFKLPGHQEGIVVPVLGPGGRISAQADVSLLREYRATLQQIAEECGPDRIAWDEDDGLKDLAKALEASPLSPSFLVGSNKEVSTEDSTTDAKEF